MKDRKKQKSHVDNAASKKAGTKQQLKSRKLFDIDTGKPAPKGAAQSEQYISFSAYVKQHVEQPDTDKMTYVNPKTGEPVPGITEETYQRGQHITLYTWLLSQKYAEFSKILDEGGDLPRKKQNKQQETPAQKKNRKRQARNKASRKARAEGRWKSSKLFNINTGKPAPEGASKSEQYITFTAYVHRHVEQNKMGKTTYVNTKTGKPAPGITKETHQRGKHSTLYSWRVSQKHAEFSKILKQGGNLPLVPSRKRKQQEKAEAVNEQKVDLLPPTLSAFVPPIAETASAFGDHHFPSSTSHPLSTPPDTPLHSKLDEALEASAQRISSPIISPTDPVSPLSSPRLDAFVDNILLTENPFAATNDAPVLASLTEADITKQAATATKEQLPPLSENPIENEVEMNLDLSFSEAMSPLLPTTPLYVYHVEASDAVTRPCLDPAISAAQDSFEQDTGRKRKPWSHSFFKPKEDDYVEPVRRKAKTLPSDSSVEHPLPVADTSDSISEAFFIPSPSANRPIF